MASPPDAEAPPIPYGSVRTSLAMSVPFRVINDDTWRHLGLMAAKVAYHGGANATFSICDAYIEVYDMRWVTTRLRVNRPQCSGSREDAACRVEVTSMAPAAVMTFKRFIVACAVLCPSITFWVEDMRNETSEPPFRRDVNKFWSVTWKTPTQWLAHVLHEVFIPPIDAPCPAS